MARSFLKANSSAEKIGGRNIIAIRCQPGRAADDVKDVSDYIYKVTTKLYLDHGPLGSHDCPGVFQVDTPRCGLFGSMIMLPDTCLAVDAALKPIIGTLDPGTHQFWPLRILMPDGTPYPEQDHGLTIGRCLDSFSPEQSDPASVREEFGLHYVDVPNTSHFAGLAMDRRVIGTSHTRRETRLMIPNVCCSDQGIAETNTAGLRLPKHVKLNEV